MSTRTRLDFDLDTTALRRYLHAGDGEVLRWVVRLTDRIRERAKLSCPVRTGRLRDSLQSHVESDSDVLVGEVGSNLVYARAVHERVRGRPFLREAMVEVAREAGIE